MRLELNGLNQMSVNNIAEYFSNKPNVYVISTLSHGLRLVSLDLKEGTDLTVLKVQDNNIIIQIA